MRATIKQLQYATYVINTIDRQTDRQTDDRFNHLKNIWDRHDDHVTDENKRKITSPRPPSQQEF
jgi:hypothetical protein